jgi:hypothetical protein
MSKEILQILRMSPSFKFSIRGPAALQYLISHAARINEKNIRLDPDLY